MDSGSHISLIFISLLFAATYASAATSFRPKALVLPVTKDGATLQYITRIDQRTPLVPITLTLDLGCNSFWVDCDKSYVSSTFRPARCGSAQCSLAGHTGCGRCFDPPCCPPLVNNTPRPGCNNNTCGLGPDNNVAFTSSHGELGSDVVSVQSTNGKTPGRVVSAPNILFVCGNAFVLKGLASGVEGVAGLGRNRIALPSQFSSSFSFSRKFAICLSSSTNSKGVLFFGDGPYSFLPNVVVDRNSLSYTPLIINPVSTAPGFFLGDPSVEYFIGVKSIKINEKNVPINTTLLSINQEGYGGTKISTVKPYTIMETSLYHAVTQFFIKELGNIPRVAPAAPFGVCFDANKIGSTRVGPGVPSIDLLLHNKNVIWKIFGANSMVRVNNDVLCLGFLDGGVNPKTSIVIGGHQVEDNLLQFDLASSRLGFSSSLFFRRTTCANFNFTSHS